jgi:hypothetical protein
MAPHPVAYFRPIIDLVASAAMLAGALALDRPIAQAPHGHFFWAETGVVSPSLRQVIGDYQLAHQAVGSGGARGAEPVERSPHRLAVRLQDSFASRRLATRTDAVSILPHSPAE